MSMHDPDTATQHGDLHELLRVSEILRSSQERVVLAKHLLQSLAGIETHPFYMRLFEFLTEQDTVARDADETRRALLARIDEMTF